MELNYQEFSILKKIFSYDIKLNKDNHHPFLAATGMIFLISSLIRFTVALNRGWNFHMGELLVSFPMYPVLESYNYNLYLSTHNYQHFGETLWFYGPFSHLVHYPIILLAPNLNFFMRFMLVFYVCALFITLFYFSKLHNEKQNYIYTIFLFGLTLGDFSVLENLQGKQIELMEFIFLLIAFLCLKYKKYWLSGFSLCLAATAKLLPFIFFPYLIIKKRYKSIIAFIILLLLIIFITELTLGWENYLMFNRQFTNYNYGSLSVETFIGTQPFRNISQSHGSFYTFILSFFSDIDLNHYIPRVRYLSDNYILPNWIFIATVVIMTIASFMVIYKSKNNYLLDLAIISSLMLSILPHCAPHFYIFSLFGLYYILHLLLNPIKIYHYIKINKYIIILIFILINLLLGGFIPFFIYNKLLNFKSSHFHFMTAYGLQGFGTFILWLTLMILEFSNKIRKKLAKT